MKYKTIKFKLDKKSYKILCKKAKKEGITFNQLICDILWLKILELNENDCLLRRNADER